MDVYTHKMLFRDLEEGIKKEKIKETLERIKDKEASDLFYEFKLDHRDMRVTMKEFYEFVQANLVEFGLKVRE
jgi:hypothetical protein